MTRQDRATRDRHRPKAGDDPGGHVHGDGDRGPCRRADDCQEQDPRDEVGEIGLTPVTCGLRAAKPGTHRAAEDVHEQEQEDDRQGGREEREGRVTAHPSQ
jgi:hypothetical protein